MRCSSPQTSVKESCMKPGSTCRICYAALNDAPKYTRVVEYNPSTCMMLLPAHLALSCRRLPPFLGLPPQS